MFYYLYKTTNLINDKIYIGVHKSEKLIDSYYGSGKLLNLAIKKYGKKNFVREIIQFFESEEEAFFAESQIVNEEFVKSDLTYNIMLGGFGSANATELYKKKFQNDPKFKKMICDNLKRACQIYLDKLKNNPEFAESERLRRIEMSKLSKTPEALEKKKQTFIRTKHQQGEKNSQFGTKWITNGIENKKIKKWKRIPVGFRKGRVAINNKS